MGKFLAYLLSFLAYLFKLPLSWLIPLLIEQSPHLILILSRHNFY